MHNYTYQPIVTEKLYDSSGAAHTIVNPNRLELFKSTMEAHVATLTTEMQVLKSHVSWIEPRLNDYHKFMEWMQRVHPDVIEAYTQATKVEGVLDKANDEMVYFPQNVAMGASA
jgi:hypothetical protein